MEFLLVIKRIKKVPKNLPQNLRTEQKSQHHQKKKPETEATKSKPIKKSGKTKTDKPKPKTEKPSTTKAEKPAAKLKPKTEKPKTEKPKTDKAATDKPAPKTDKAATDKTAPKHEDKKPSKRLAKLRGKKVHVKEVAPGRALLRKQRLRNKTRFLEPSLADQFEKGRLYARITSRPGQCGHADGYVLEGEELSFYMKKILTKKKK